MFSPPLLAKIQPDSFDYINGGSHRPYIYHMIINSLEFLNIDLVFFQIILMSLSIVYLSWVLFKKKFNLPCTLIFYILITTNIFYTSFPKTVLTESIFFSLINFAVAFLINSKITPLLTFIYGLIIGLIFSIKPIGMLIALILLIFYFTSFDFKKKLLLFLSSFFIPILVESYFFSQEHNERESLLPTIVRGKLFLLSGKDSFDIDRYPDDYRELLETTKNEYFKVLNFISKQKKIFLRSELLADYEVVAQTQTFNLESIKKLNFDKTKLNNEFDVLALNLVKNNFFDLANLSFSHYLGNWSIGSKFVFFDKELKNVNHKIPKIEQLIKSSGPINLPNLKLLILAQYFFISLLLVLTIFTILVFFQKIKLLKVNLDSLDFFSIISVQCYLISVSIINVSTPRYLMAIYPLLIILLIRFAILFLTFTKKT
jgi:hypothetical protein